MFIVYYASTVLAVFASRDNADEYIRDEKCKYVLAGLNLQNRFTVDFVEEDEDLWHSINR